MEGFYIALVFKFLSQWSSLTRLPDNGIVNRKPRVLIPNNCRFPLIGNANCFDLIGLDATFNKDLSDHRLHRVPNFIGIVFHPTSLRKNLSEFLLTRADLLAFFIKNDSPRTSCSLVNRHDESFLRHKLPS